MSELSGKMRRIFELRSNLWRHAIFFFIQKLASKRLNGVDNLSSSKVHGDILSISGRRRDLETEEMVEDMQSRIRDLERKNEGLSNKVETLQKNATLGRMAMIWHSCVDIYREHIRYCKRKNFRWFCIIEKVLN